MKKSAGQIPHPMDQKSHSDQVNKPDDERLVNIMKIEFVWNRKTISGAPISALVENRVLPRWLVNRVKPGMFMPSEFLELERSFRKITQVLILIWLSIFFTWFTTLILTLRGDLEALAPLIYRAGWYPPLLLLACSSGISFFEFREGWIEKLQRLEMHVCRREVFIKAIRPDIQRHEDTPLGIFNLAGITDERFDLGAKALLNDLAYSKVYEQFENPHDKGAIERHDQSFRQVMKVFTELGAVDGDFRPFYDHAKARYDQIVAERRRQASAHDGVAAGALSRGSSSFSHRPVSPPGGLFYISLYLIGSRSRNPSKTLDT